MAYKSGAQRLSIACWLSGSPAMSIQLGLGLLGFLVANLLV